MQTLQNKQTKNKNVNTNPSKHIFSHVQTKDRTTSPQICKMQIKNFNKTRHGGSAKCSPTNSRKLWQQNLSQSKAINFILLP